MRLEDDKTSIGPTELRRMNRECHRFLGYTLWHTANAICCFSAKKIGDTGTFVYKNEFFVVL